MPLAGKFGFVTFKAAPGDVATTICADNWSVGDTSDALDTTNFCTGGYQDNIDGIRKGSYTVSGPVLFGQTLPAVGSIATITVGAGAATFGTDFILVKSIQQKLSVTGRYEFELSGTTTTADLD